MTCQGGLIQAGAPFGEGEQVCVALTPDCTRGSPASLSSEGGVKMASEGSVGVGSSCTFLSISLGSCAFLSALLARV